MLLVLPKRSSRADRSLVLLLLVDGLVVDCDFADEGCSCFGRIHAKGRSFDWCFRGDWIQSIDLLLPYYGTSKDDVV